MVVVSAGVIMNILMAIVLFVIAFMSGVRLRSPRHWLGASGLARGGGRLGAGGHDHLDRRRNSHDLQ